MSYNNIHHHGRIIKKAIKKSGVTITNLANILNVNRKTIYNWLSAVYIRKEVIHRIGLTIQHDFSTEFPQHFSKITFSPESIRRENNTTDGNENIEWKEKYIGLLEQYNELLLTMTSIVQIKKPFALAAQG